MHKTHKSEMCIRRDDNSVCLAVDVDALMLMWKKLLECELNKISPFLHHVLKCIKIVFITS